MSIQVSHKAIQATELKQLMRPFVYGWQRKGIFLYIGCTARGFVRILYGHAVINKVEPVQDDDYFEFWFVEKTELLAREKELIEFYKPKYNLLHAVPLRRSHKKIKYYFCASCNVKFKPDQMDHNECWKCRFADKNKVNWNNVFAKPAQPKLVKLPH